MPTLLRAALVAAITTVALLANVATGSAKVMISEFKTGGSSVQDESIENKLNGGKGKNKYAGGEGNDSVSARNGVKESVDCGKGSKDTATVDRNDTVKNCETVRRPRK